MIYSYDIKYWFANTKENTKIYLYNINKKKKHSPLTKKGAVVDIDSIIDTFIIDDLNSKRPPPSYNNNFFCCRC